jgi:PAS domain-containing protein
VITETINLIMIAIAVLIAVVGLGIWYALTRRHSQKLREKFGPEYDYTLEQTGDPRAAEENLKEREKRVKSLDIRELDSEQWNRYILDWTEIQAAFVDDPSKSVEAANRLITEVMIARGFPVADFEQRAADLSVLYPDFVPNYRSAYAIALKNQRDGASTEDLRQAMVYYHSMFEELLGITEVQEVEVKEKEVVTQ